MFPPSLKLSLSGAKWGAAKFDGRGTHRWPLGVNAAENGDFAFVLRDVIEALYPELSFVLWFKRLYIEHDEAGSEVRSQRYFVRNYESCRNVKKLV